uniref:Uncharacterized protein n=1 Tax=Salix viminalis TaxID=40686 RepID=A0A6N2KST3_SALVM
MRVVVYLRQETESQATICLLPLISISFAFLSTFLRSSQEKELTAFPADLSVSQSPFTKPCSRRVESLQTSRIITTLSP